MEHLPINLEANITLILKLKKKRHYKKTLYAEYYIPK